MFAFSFTASHPFGFLGATLAFCCGLWLGAEAHAETGSSLHHALADQFGPLEWIDEHRFPTQCEALPAAVLVLEATALENAKAAPDPFVVVEGVVQDVFQGRDRWFVNFGPDYRTDFTVSVQEKPLRTVRQLWPDPENWIGQRVRVRGYADLWNGLFIEWDFPQQLCFIDEVPYKL